MKPGLGILVVSGVEEWEKEGLWPLLEVVVWQGQGHRRIMGMQR